MKLMSERNRKLYLEDIPPNLKRQHFQSYFSKYGQLEYIRVFNEKRRNGAQKNYAFVLFKKEADALTALKAGPNHVIQGFEVFCKITKLREELKALQDDKQKGGEAAEKGASDGVNGGKRKKKRKKKKKRNKSNQRAGVVAGGDGRGFKSGQNTPNNKARIRIEDDNQEKEGNGAGSGKQPKGQTRGGGGGTKSRSRGKRGRNEERPPRKQENGAQAPRAPDFHRGPMPPHQKRGPNYQHQQQQQAQYGLNQHQPNDNDINSNNFQVRPQYFTQQIDLDQLEYLHNHQQQPQQPVHPGGYHNNNNNHPMANQMQHPGLNQRPNRAQSEMYVDQGRPYNHHHNNVVNGGYRGPQAFPNHPNHPQNMPGTTQAQIQQLMAQNGNFTFRGTFGERNQLGLITSYDSLASSGIQTESEERASRQTPVFEQNNKRIKSYTTAIDLDSAMEGNEDTSIYNPETPIKQRQVAHTQINAQKLANFNSDQNGQKQPENGPDGRQEQSNTLLSTIINDLRPSLGGINYGQYGEIGPTERGYVYENTNAMNINQYFTTKNPQSVPEGVESQISSEDLNFSHSSISSQKFKKNVSPGQASDLRGMNNTISGLTYNSESKIHQKVQQPQQANLGPHPGFHMHRAIQYETNSDIQPQGHLKNQSEASYSALSTKSTPMELNSRLKPPGVNHPVVAGSGPQNLEDVINENRIKVDVASMVPQFEENGNKDNISAISLFNRKPNNTFLTNIKMKGGDTQSRLGAAHNPDRPEEPIKKNKTEEQDFSSYGDFLLGFRMNNNSNGTQFSGKMPPTHHNSKKYTLEQNIDIVEEQEENRRSSSGADDEGSFGHEGYLSEDEIIDNGLSGLEDDFGEDALHRRSTCEIRKEMVLNVTRCGGSGGEDDDEDGFESFRNSFVDKEETAFPAIVEGMDADVFVKGRERSSGVLSFKQVQEVLRNSESSATS